MKSLSKALGFFFLCEISYYGISYFAFTDTIGKKLPPVSQVKTHFDFWNDHTTYDWVVLGSSHAYRGIDPRVLESRGLRVYNLGSSSQTPVNSLALLKSLSGKTKGVILEIYPVTFNLSGRESFYDLLSNGYSFNILWSQWLKLKDARSLQLLLTKPIIDRRHRDDQPREESYFGYVENSQSAPANLQYAVYKLDNKENLEIQWSAMLDILNFAKRNQIELKLVMAPLPKALIIDGEADFKEKLLAILKQNDLSIQDLSRAHPLDDKQDFFDADHLNSRGVTWWMKNLQF